MTARKRVLWFGGSGLLVLLGVIAGPAIGGITGEAIMIALEGLGGIAIVSLVFLEVGLSEDRERDREAGAKGVAPRRRLRPPPRRRRRPG
jgi:hypothetical protein